MVGDINAMKRAAAESAKIAEKLGPGVMYAITTALPNMMNGATWGFASEREVLKHVASIQSSGGNIIARRLSNACILEVSPQYLVNSVAVCAPGILTQSDLAEMMTKQAEAVLAFERFLIARVKDGAKSNKLPFTGTVGIYCTNEVTSISLKGKSYPAFRVNISTFLQQCFNYGYLVKVGDNFMLPQQAGQSGDALWKSMMVSPTQTGVFVEIQSTYTWEGQMSVLDKNFKARTKKQQ